MNKYFLCVLLLIGCGSGNNDQKLDQPRDFSIVNQKVNQLMDSNICALNFIDDQGEVVCMPNILSNEAVVVLFYTSSSCWACVSDYLEIFNSIGSHFKGKVKAITNGTPLRSLRIRAIQYTNINFFKTADDILTIGSFMLLDNEPAMCMIDNKCKIMSFRWGLAKDSLENPYFSEIQDYLKHH